METLEDRATILVIRDRVSSARKQLALIFPLTVLSVGRRLSRARRRGPKANDRRLLGSALSNVHKIYIQRFPWVLY
jgi:hypothetical protein